MSFSQDIAKKSYSLVPSLDLNNDWSDKKLYEYFDLDNEEINFIESHIKEMI
jgi:site-specific DNA-methyltransferase (adenine-specific)